MSKGLLDVAMIVGAIGLGGYVSVASNPLTASVVFLLVLAAWELVKMVPSLLRKNGTVKTN